MTRRPQFFRRREADRRHTPAVQASDLGAAMSDPIEMARQAPVVPRPREMIEQVKVVGRDTLTAADNALYEGLVAWAQAHDGEAEGHAVPLATVMSYAQVESTDALVAMMHRLSTTYVKYDIRSEDWRRRGTLPLVLAEVAENLKRGDGFVRFSIPEPVRRLLIAPRSYAMLELAAFPRFKSRYSARLYQRLALRAGYSEVARGDWLIEPQALAKSLGFAWTRYADFRRNVLKPALDDIQREVKRFQVSCVPVYASGRRRGRPAVSKLRFEFTPAVVQPLAALQKTPLAEVEAAFIQRDDGHIPAKLLPSADTFSRLMTYRGKAHPEGKHMTGAALSEHWRAAVDEALSGAVRSDFRAPLPGNDLWGDDLLKAVDLVGIGETVRFWIDCCEWTGRYMPRLDPAPVLAPPPVPTASSTPEERAERRKYLIRKFASGELETINRYKTTSRTYPIYIDSLCDPEVGVWSYFVEEESFGPRLAAALRRVGKMSDVHGQRQTLINLLKAVADFDLKKVDEISTAVLSSSAD